MIDFEGYYLVPPDQVAYIETRRGGGDAQYGLFLGLSGGKELGVWYRTEEARKAAYTKLARQVEIGKRQDREDILYRLRLIEACINKTDIKRSRPRTIRPEPPQATALNSARRRWGAARSSGIGRATPCTAERASARPPAPC